MHSQSDMRSGGQILVSALRAHGADTIFGVPGESALPIFDALIDERRIRFITCRHEANAAHMAEADAKLTGKPGVCLVSRGPGAMHAAIGVHSAHQNSSPMILLIGQVPRKNRGLEAFQEMELASMFAAATKWSAEIDAASRIPEYIKRAYQIATHGRPGPVVLSIPEDVLAESSAVSDPQPHQPVEAYPSAADVLAVRDALAGAQRPLVIVGGGGWSPARAEALTRFLETNDIPVVAGFRAQDVVDNASPTYIGDMSLGGSRNLAARISQADVVLVIGERLGEVTTRGYSALSPTHPGQHLIHVYPGAEELGRVFRADQPILSNVGPFVDALCRLEPLNPTAWREWRGEGREEYAQFVSPPKTALALDLAKAIRHLREILPEDAIVTNGAGNCNIWLHRFFSYRKLGTQVAPQSGAMGYGLSAGIAAKLRHPDKIVVAFAGDGCFLMASPDFATACQYSIPVVVLVANNSTYGSIRMHQERHYPGRPSGTALINPDFAALARAHGGFGVVVEKDADFPAALAGALTCGGPAIIELRLDERQLTPDMRI